MKQAEHSELIWLQIHAKRLLGHILTAQGRHEQAAEYFEEALQEYRACGMRLEYARTLQQYGAVLLQQMSPGEMSYQQGLSYLHEAHGLFMECHAPLDLQRTERLLDAYGETPRSKVRGMI